MIQFILNEKLITERFYMSQKVSQVYMVVLQQSNLAAGIEFYKKLGLKLLFDQEGKWAEFGLGQVVIGLAAAEAVEKGRYTGLVFKTADLKALAAELRDDGVEFVVEPQVATHGVMASLLDPSGNRLDLYEPTHQKVREVLEKEGKLCGPEGAEGDACGDKPEGGCCKK
jgi:predicted enzyme related to lactoylglutathione lyase